VGTTPVIVVPEGPRTTPLRSYSGTHDSSTPKTLSTIEASITCPGRPAARSRW